MKSRAIFFFCMFLMAPVFITGAYAQVDKYTQASNELDFNSTLSQKWALEFDATQTWTSKPPNGNIFHSLSELSGTAIIHYKPTDKWKLSYMYAYYYDKYLPEINQDKAPEWRSTFEAIYYIRRQRSIVSTRVRLEDRHIKNTDSVFEAVDRFRGMIKIVYPFNGKTIDKHILYGIASEELMFKNKSKVSGNDFFDRNKITLGLGYGITDNTQMELTYSNEYLPRTTDKSYNIIQVNFVFNDLISHIGHYIFDKKTPAEGSSGN